MRDKYCNNCERILSLNANLTDQILKSNLSDTKASKEIARLESEVNRLQNLLDKARLLVDQANKRADCERK